MGFSVGDVMQVNTQTVGPELSLLALEEELSQWRVGGCPVVDDDKLVGVVSRSDIVRQLVVEHDLAEQTSDFYFDDAGFHEVPLKSYKQIADRVGERLSSMSVGDVMSRNPIVVDSTQPLVYAAQLMQQHRIHRLPVTYRGRLVGIITTMHFVGLFADGRAQAE